MYEAVPIPETEEPRKYLAPAARFAFRVLERDKIAEDKQQHEQRGLQEPLLNHKAVKLFVIQFLK